jgi:hypothetical protein
MESNWASDNLQVIRTLMERSALYRRALAPIMLATGLIGLAGAGLAWFIKTTSPATFTEYWTAICAFVIATDFAIARRQALKQSEPLWTPPAKRVAMAMAAPLFAGAAMTAPFSFITNAELYLNYTMIIVSVWLAFFGCGLHSAGFYISRGVKILGAIFILCGALLLWILPFVMARIPADAQHFLPHAAMGLTFGGLPLVSGIYLYFTESRELAA